MLTRRALIAVVLWLSVVCPVAALGETGAAAWLRYAPLDQIGQQRNQNLPASTVLLGKSSTLAAAQNELIRGVQGMLGRTLRVQTGVEGERAIVIGTLPEVQKLAPALKPAKALSGDAYWVTSADVRGMRCLVITGATDRGVLYGVFAFLRKLGQNQNADALDEMEQPSAPVRWANQWDNLDGSIERGYGGRSIFFDDGKVRADLTRVSEYGRLLASVGINGCTVNNVNASTHMLDDDFIPQLARIADAFRPWGVQISISINMSSPKASGGLDSFDPLDPKVAEWWKKKFDEVYRQIPDFAGVVVKADSEGQAGPSQYGRTPADAANAVARALKPHGGLVFYRGFVYNHHLDWNNLKNDRAKAAYDNFHPLDGKFDDNVVIQIKNGPIDFQVREPASPIFGGLEKTNEAVEVQVTQEYMGQQFHTVYLVPMWKEVLDFDMKVGGRSTPVKEILSGRTFNRPTGGYVAVVNVGLDTNWLANHLAMANLYGFGRLVWNPNLSSQAIVDEWTRLTFGNDDAVVRTINGLQMATWPTYEKYTGYLGLQTLTNITGAHYGPAPESQERNGWGQWIRAEHDAVGMDRSVATGTGFVGQYRPDVQKQYETLAATPENLLLFFHHVPYTHKLRSGKTVIQTIYDVHYEGAEQAAGFVSQWKTLAHRIDDQRYEDVLAQLNYQAGHAIVWRDAINDWFNRISGISDEKGRVGNHPNRYEAEKLQLDGYELIDVKPWEGASGGGKAVACAKGAQSCSVHMKFEGKPGWYEVDVEYFDQMNGKSTYRVFVNGQQVDTWLADRLLPARVPNADSSVRRRIFGVALRAGDEIRIEGLPDGAERAGLDYVEILQPETKQSSGGQLRVAGKRKPAARHRAR
jgi:alpha-glucuronidase